MNSKTIRVIDQAGSESVLALPSVVTEAARGLAQAPELYFAGPAAASQIALESLVWSHFDIQGALGAARLMRRSAQGQHQPRAPIEVRPLDDGRHLVLDGNSTAAVGHAAGWRTIPAFVLAPAPKP